MAGRGKGQVGYTQLYLPRALDIRRVHLGQIQGTSPKKATEQQERVIWASLASTGQCGAIMRAGGRGRPQFS